MITPIDISQFEQLKASGELPSPKGVALAIIEMSRRDDVSSGELAQLIKTDPAFVSRLLRAANRAGSHRSRPAVSVLDALAVLGLPAVRGLALGFSLISQHQQGKCQAFDYKGFWSASLLNGLALQALAERMQRIQPEEAFTVGLLCRIGELGLATVFPDAYSKLLGECAGGAQLRARELEIFTLTHLQLAAGMFAEWGMPRVFADAVLYHETLDAAPFPEDAREYALVLALNAARAIADVALAADADRLARLDELVRAGARVGILPDQLHRLADAVAVEWREWGALLGVDTRNLPPFSDMVAEAVAVADAEDDATVAPAGPVKVLVVDDDPGARLILRSVLEKQGFVVFEAADGADGLRMALEAQPQILISDWIMPGMDGMQLVRTLRQTKLGRGMFVLVLTAFDSDERLIEAYDAGVDDFMPKPIKPRVLAARLRAGLRVIHLQTEVERDREEIRRFAAELALANRRLEEAALTDPLTGFPNRRYSAERIQQEWAGSQRTGRPLSCMVVDLDGFKAINDSHGHDAGDAVLHRVAEAFKRGLRAQDVICRVGGDEFLVICPETGLADAIVCAERIRRAVEATAITVGRQQIRMSVSIGVAARDDRMAAPAELIKRADQGVYRAKQLGRNRVAALQSPNN